MLLCFNWTPFLLLSGLTSPSVTQHISEGLQSIGRMLMPQSERSLHHRRSAANLTCLPRKLVIPKRFLPCSDHLRLSIYFLQCRTNNPPFNNSIHKTTASKSFWGSSKVFYGTQVPNCGLWGWDCFKNQGGFKYDAHGFCGGKVEVAASIDLLAFGDNNQGGWCQAHSGSTSKELIALSCWPLVFLCW